MSDRQTWTNAIDLGRTPGPRDEFSPDVEAAIADLRARHGLDGTAPSADAARASARDLLPGVNRRNFLQLTGAAAVLGLVGCGNQHPDTLVPYAVQPEGAVLGKAMWYSSTLTSAGEPVPVMVKCYDGRPIKLEGNPDHPVTLGRLDARTQAALVDLYDPDRLQDGPHVADAATSGAVKAVSWAELDKTVGAWLAEPTARIALVTPPLSGPGELALIRDLTKAFPGRFTHAAFSAYPRRAESRAYAQVTGDLALPVYNLERAELLLSFGDILGGNHAGLAEQVGFGELVRKRAQGDGERVIAVEAVLSQTGTCSDLRVRCAHDQLGWAAWRIAAAVGADLGVSLPSGIAADLAGARHGALTLPGGGDATARIAKRLLDVKRAGGASVVYAGGAATSGSDQQALHAAATWLNQALGNLGATVTRHAERSDDLGAVDALAEAGCDVLILAGVNPAQQAPALWKKLSAAKHILAISDRLDETAVAAHAIAPMTHGLEAWGDGCLRPGLPTLQQPCILPLWDARDWQQTLLAVAVAGGATAFAVDKPATVSSALISVVSRKPLYQSAAAGVLAWGEHLRRTWTTAVRGAAGSAADAAVFWSGALARGVVTVPAMEGGSRDAQVPEARLIAPRDSGLTLVLNASRVMGDGRQLNNAWLNEIPDPVSRICWDNYVAISPTTARELGISENDVVIVQANGLTLTLAAHVQEGTHPGTAEVFCGWGRTHAGQVARMMVDNGHSVDVFPLAGRFGAGPSAVTATIATTGRSYQLAHMQGHDWTEGRPLELEVEPGHAKHAHREPTNLWGAKQTYAGRKWGMAIDLDACTGCNACIVACQAENNIPVVGRDEVRKNREMHWMRIDRYYQGHQADADHLDVTVVNQPVVCFQCDNAPCEAACPANATMHNQEGISLQIYNRCIGTRYCANNCPYKVRRFNWYEYSAYRAGPVGSASPLDRIARNMIMEGGATSAPSELAHAPLTMLLNPEVIVRSKGVMEKCNFCYQRTREIHEQEKSTGRRYRDGTITTACAQACPTDAIVFGDINDESSRVSTTVASSPTGYAYLVLNEELNTRPSVAYLRRLRHRPATADEARHLAGDAAEHGEHQG